MKQMLEEGYFSAENRPSDPTSSIRENIARKEYNLAFEERESKSKSGNRNLAGKATMDNRGKTTIEVVNPEEYNGKDYDFVNAPKQGYGYEGSYNENSANSGRKPRAKASLGVSKVAAKKPVHQTLSKASYFQGNKRVGTKINEPIEEESKRGRSRSNERNSTGRPRSANRERSRDYASTYSHYSSVYSRILNTSEANKIRKLVGEQNADLDVISANFRASS